MMTSSITIIIPAYNESQNLSRIVIDLYALLIKNINVFKEILDYFDEHDVFVFNDTKVFPARLYGNKEKTGARIEVFLLRELNEEFRLWDVLVDPARKIRIGNKLYFGEDDSMVAEVIDNTTSRGRTLRFLYEGSHEEFKRDLYALGEPPRCKCPRIVTRTSYSGCSLCIRSAKPCAPPVLGLSATITMLLFLDFRKPFLINSSS